MNTCEILDTASYKAESKKYEGRTYMSYSQTAYLHKDGHPFPLEFSLSMKEGEPPYPKGQYSIHYDAEVKNNRLKLSPRLVPVNQSQSPLKKD